MEPWEVDWGGRTAKPTAEPAQIATDVSQEPWELDWGRLAAKRTPEDYRRPLTGLGNSVPSVGSQTPAKASTRAPEGSQSQSIDSVFTNLIQAESKGVHGAGDKLTTSPKGAEGITQLMPTTAANPGFGIKPVQDKSEKEYLRVGKEYLSALYGRYRDWEKALAAYNAGMGNVEKAIGKAERYGGDWKEFLPKKKETLPYIEKILRKTNA